MSEIIVSRADADNTTRGDIINDDDKFVSVQFMTRNTPNGGVDQTNRCLSDDPKAPCTAGGDYNVSARSRHSGGVGVVLYDTPDSPMDDVLESVVPAEYNSASKLVQEVKLDTKTLDFQLVTPAGK